MRTIKRWIGIGLAELVLSLVLIAIAPVFLNSNQPIVGFLIWGMVLLMLAASGLYVIFRLADAHNARRLFVTHFPEYSYLGMNYFLEISAAQVAKNLELLQAAQADPDFQSLNISPLDLLRGSKRR